jgi:hypothetical protein
MSAPDLSNPIRDALLANVAITSELTPYLNSYPIFTRRPSPDDTPFPVVMVSQDISVIDQDGINDYRPLIRRDVAVYHRNDDASHYRLAVQIALRVWRMFNERRRSLIVPDWDVVDVTAEAPIAISNEAGTITGRIVQLRVLVAKATA